jgi:hypothetical protein
MLSRLAVWGKKSLSQLFGGRDLVVIVSQSNSPPKLITAYAIVPLAFSIINLSILPIFSPLCRRTKVP